MKQSTVLILLLAAIFVLVQSEGNITEEDYYYGVICENDDFFCDYDEPSTFYRCIEGVYHTFHCPSGLHFSVGMQTCDWPHLADCSSSEIEIEDNHDVEESSPSEGNDQTSSVSHYQENDKIIGSSEGTSWISQAAASGKSWWRPDDVSLDQFQDVSSIKKPAFQPHIPDISTSESESSAEKSEESQSLSKSGSTEVSSESNLAEPIEKKASSSESKYADSVEKKASSSESKYAEPIEKKASSSESTHSEPIERQASSSVKWNEGSCSSSCQLPSCYCAGSDIPKGLPASSVPQMVMITFDDEVSGAFYGYYQRLFRPGRYNPNGCPVRGCLYVSGSGTEYDLVYPLYAMGIEIASHTISHRFPHTWWSTASYKEFVDEASGMRNNLITRSGLPSEEIKGFRVPFLQIGGDNMYSAIYDSKFVYDTSMFTGHEWEGGEPVWPFTLDYVPAEPFCMHGPCPTKQYPGMWEIPVQRWYGLDGLSCAMPDGCSSTGDAEETLEYLKSNFRRFHGSNRAPFGVFIHARWFNTEHNLEGLDRFIDYLLTLDDVYFVTPSQVIDWMKNPTPLSEINGFGPWSCQGGAKDVWREKGE